MSEFDDSDEVTDEQAKMMAAGMALLELANENTELKAALKALVLAIDKIGVSLAPDHVRIIEGPLNISKHVLGLGPR